MSKYFEFEVSLRDIRPRIWRRFLIRETATFLELHEAIQAAGRWGDYHLWPFCAPDGRRVIAGVPDKESWEPIPDAKKIKLKGSFSKPGDNCLYRYDFGDDWEHDVALRQIVELPEVFHRKLVAGRRAFPPEDCGSVPGYYECLAAVGAYSYPAAEKNAPGPEELADRREWLGDWTPDIDLEEIREGFDQRKAPGMPAAPRKVRRTPANKSSKRR